MTGRWPANVILSPDMADALDEQSGYQRDGVAVHRNGGRTIGSGLIYSGYNDGKPAPDQGYGSGGGASRFFLTAGYEPWELEWIIANGLTPCGE